MTDTSLTLLDEGLVDAAEIDALGHLNVRGYMRRIRRAGARLLAGVGLPDGASLARVDTYSRYRQEQRAGARLHVLGALLGVDDAGIRSQFEVHNAETGAVAATFLIGFAPREDATDRRLPIDRDLLTNATTAALPVDRAPRSLSMAPIDPAVERAVAERVLAWGHHRCIDRPIPPEDADRHGYLDEEEELLFSRSRHGDLPPASLIAPAAGQGAGLAWPLSETRLVLFARPRVGDTLRSFSTDIAVGEKTRTTRRWTLGLRDGALVAVQDAVALAIDPARRAAVPIPENLRTEAEVRIAALQAIRDALARG